MITEPAQCFGYTLEAGLLRKILNDVEQELSCLPLLQFTLLKLWEKRDRRKQQLAYSAYLEMGGVLGALNHHAEWVYKRLSPSAQDWVKWICLKLVRADAEIKDTRQRQTKQRLLELAGDNSEHLQVVTTILQQLIDERLLISEEEEGEVWVDLVHESLMEGWHRFAKWREETWEQRQITVRLEDALHNWQKTPTNDNLAEPGLLKGIRENWDTLEPELNTDVKEFYQQSVKYHNKQAFLAKLEPEFLAQSNRNRGQSTELSTPAIENINSHKISISAKARDRFPIFSAKELLFTHSHQETEQQKQSLACQENIEKVVKELQKKDISVINIVAGDYINVRELNNCEGVALGRDSEATSKKEQATNQDE